MVTEVFQAIAGIGRAAAGQAEVGEPAVPAKVSVVINFGFESVKANYFQVFVVGNKCRQVVGQLVLYSAIEASLPVGRMQHVPQSYPVGVQEFQFLRVGFRNRRTGNAGNNFPEAVPRMGEVLPQLQRTVAWQGTQDEDLDIGCGDGREGGFKIRLGSHKYRATAIYSCFGGKNLAGRGLERFGMPNPAFG